eukprot:Gb_22812 [translate_table: standard]
MLEVTEIGGTEMFLTEVVVEVIAINVIGRKMIVTDDMIMIENTAINIGQYPALEIDHMSIESADLDQVLENVEGSTNGLSFAEKSSLMRSVVRKVKSISNYRRGGAAESEVGRLGVRVMRRLRAKYVQLSLPLY